MERAPPCNDDMSETYAEHLQKYSSFLIFTGMIRKLLFHSIPMLLDEISSRFGGE